MSIGPLPNTPPPKSPPGPTQEALRIGAAIEHIKIHGNLDGFPAGRGERLALVTTAGKQGLLVWSRGRARYELTLRGHRHVRALRRAGRNALRGQTGGVRSGMNAVVAAAGAVVALGAAFLAFIPTGPARLSPAGPSGAYLIGRASLPAAAQAQAASAVQAPIDPAPTATEVTARVGPMQAPSERGPSSGPDGHADDSTRNPSVLPGEAARSLAAAIGSEPALVTRPTSKSTDDSRADRQETAKLEHKHKKNSRRARNWYEERDSRGPGYAYAPYPGGRRYGQWSPSPWWFR